MTELVGRLAEYTVCRHGRLLGAPCAAAPFEGKLSTRFRLTNALLHGRVRLGPVDVLADLSCSSLALTV